MRNKSYLLLLVYFVFASFTVKAQMAIGNPYSNCGKTDIVFAPQAAPCNGASVTSISFANASRTIVSGTTNTVGVVYRYSNAGIAPNGQTLDALVTVLSYSNNQDNDTSDYTDADVNTIGFDQNLQPSIGQANNFITATPWAGSITYRIQFVLTGTTTPKVITVAATTTDNDGSNACGGLKESVSYSSALNQILTNITTTTQQVVSGNTITAKTTTNQASIGSGPDYAAAALYVNVSEFNWTYSFNTAGNCAVNGAAEGRYGSLNLGCQITFDQAFVTQGLSGKVFNDVNGTTDGIADLGGTNAGGTLYANLVDANGYVVSSVAVASDGSYSFAAFKGSYTIQLSTNQGTESSLAPVLALPSGWVNTGENLGTGTGTDGARDGSLAVTIDTTAVNNANFGIQQRPTVSNATAANRTNPGGTINSPVPATTFTATDPSPGTVTSIRITAFPSNATTITINGTQYSSGNFPMGGVTVPADANGNPTQAILVDPSFTGAGTVAIPFVAIDNAGFQSSLSATASVPFTSSQTSTNANISGNLYLQGNPIRNTLVVLTDIATNAKIFNRTDANGGYLFENREVGKTYLVQPLSGKYAFTPATSVVSLTGDIVGQNFSSLAKTYHPKNDFDGDSKSDVAVFRPSDGNWYVLQSSDGQLKVFHFGLATDVPISADFDGDGKTDFAVFRPSEGTWYIWQSRTQSLRAEQFGLGSDKLVPADYDGDGRADIAVYRNGYWYIHCSSDNSIEAKSFGLGSDVPVAEDFDGDGRVDLSVYRPAEGIWYSSFSSGGLVATRFGLATDIPTAADFDGDGRADVAQFRNGYWYVLGSTTGFEAALLGSGEDKSIVGDFDGDGRADETVYRNGRWSIRFSADGTVREFYFGSPDDILIR